MAATSTSYASSYHVFLSFRGQDTRHGFTGHLYKALTDKGIHTFIDDEELHRGEEISPALVKAIQESMIAIIVLSTHYASSSFCLNELATIIHCKSKGLLVIPVFYMVDPSDVRHHKGSFGDALTKHERRFPENKLQEWKDALHQVANLSGYHFQEGDTYEYKFIGSIVDRVSNRINNYTPLHVADHAVGLESRVKEVLKLLDVGPDDVLMVGIHGMGGVGKSTLARAVYNNLIAKKFDGLCFLENMREESEKHGLKHLQRILLQEILGDEKIKITSVERGASMIPQRLQRKKVFIVLDDVDNLKQLEAIVGSPEWFGPGSRVIITTRDHQLLACHQVKRIYEVQKLNYYDARRLLTWKAFRKEKADPTHVEVLDCVLNYASGLPLALEIIGSHLFGMSVEEWNSAIKGYERIPNHQILEILQISFNALKEDEKSVFLDISCCFKGYALGKVEDILRARYGNCMKYQIRVLIEKSLIKLYHFDGTTRITLHDLIEEMGKAVVRLESPENDPSKQSRLWLRKDIIQVLQGNMRTSKIEIIHLDDPISDKEETIEWNGKAFKEMKRLQILIIKNGKFSEGPNCLPNSLRVLEWYGYPSNCLPSNFHPKELAICKLPQGVFSAFEFNGSSKEFGNLTVLSFDRCKFLTQIPNVSDLPNLVELSFEYCENLVIVHASIGFLKKLKLLRANHCNRLRSFPPLKLISLEKIELSDCASLESFPEILVKMENIWDLRYSNSSIKEFSFPFSFQHLVGLKYLHLFFGGIVQLPSSILMMPKLSSIYSPSCKGIKWIKQEEDEEKVGAIASSKLKDFSVPGCKLNDDFFSIGFTWFAHVDHLNLSGNNFTFLPECIKEFESLRTLDVSNCKYLKDIGGVPPNLKYFNAKHCRSLSSSSTSMFINQEPRGGLISQYWLPGKLFPKWFDRQSKGPSTSFWFRNNFPDNVLCLLVAPVEFSHQWFCPAPVVFINGKLKEYGFQEHQKTVRKEMVHTNILDLNLTFDRFKVPLDKEWKHVEVTYAGVTNTSVVIATGIHICKLGANMEDIRFTDPYIKRKSNCDLNSFESHNQRLLKKSRVLIPMWKFHRYNFGMYPFVVAMGDLMYDNVNFDSIHRNQSR